MRIIGKSSNVRSEESMSEFPSLSMQSTIQPPPRLRTADRQQIIPAMSLENLLEQDHQARLVWDFCLGLDLSCLYDQIRSREGGPGRAAIDPRLCVALWLYATLEGVGSARALAWLCSNHNAFRWLVGGVSVNHHTLSDFRVEHGAVLDKVLTHSVAVLREQDLVDLNRVAHDGMRVRASAGAASFRRKPTLEEHLQEAEQQVQRLKQELEENPGALSRRQAKARERAARERRERVRQALERIPEMEAKKKPEEKQKARASTTDAQATVMKMSDGGFRPAYNVQFTADCGSQAIVAVAVTTSGSDMGQLKPQIEQIHERFGVYPKEALADGGFAKHDDIAAIEEECGGCKVYTPVPAPKDPTMDRYAPHPGDSAKIIHWRERMGSAEGKAIYKDRASTAECVNAQARNRGLVRLWVRGQQKVKAIALWFAIAHNVVCGCRRRLEAAQRHVKAALRAEIGLAA
jgi:transposase